MWFPYLKQTLWISTIFPVSFSMFCCMNRLIKNNSLENPLWNVILLFILFGKVSFFFFWLQDLKLFTCATWLQTDMSGGWLTVMAYFIYIGRCVCVYVSQGFTNFGVATHNNIFPLAQGSGTYTCRAGNTWVFPLNQIWVTVEQLEVQVWGHRFITCSECAQACGGTLGPQPSALSL